MVRFLLIAAGAALVAGPWVLATSVCDDDDRPAGPGRALVYVGGGDPETLDPALATGLHELRLLGALFEGLVALDPATLAPRPAAASRFAADAAGITFHLADGQRWSDGRPLEADDFVWSWERVRAPATRSPWAGEMEGLTLRRVDARTLRLEGARARGDVLSRLVLPCFLPVPRAAIEAHGDRWTHPPNLVSNGPFRLAAWELNRRLRLERNPHYRGPVALPAIEAPVAATPALGVNLFATDAADLVLSIPAALYPELEGRPDFHAAPLYGTYFLRFNVERPPFDDPHVRRAFALAIDRESIVRHVTRSGERAAAGFCPPGVAGYEGARGPAARFDPEAARRELGLSRYGRGDALPEVAYLYEGARNGRIGEVLQDRWARVLGARVRLVPMERKVAFAAVRARDYQVAWSSWIADYPDPASFLEILRTGSGNNRTGFADPIYDGLLERAREEAGARRLATLAAAEERLLEATPVAPIYHYASGVLVSGRVSGYVPNPLNRIDWLGLSLREGPPAQKAREERAP